MDISTSSQGAVNANINVTPMADVMLVLLIIFMITAPLIAAGFQAQMPQGVNLIKAEEQNDDVVLGIDRQGQYYINTKPYAKEQVVTTLAEIFAARTKDKILYLKADNQLRMEKIQEAVDIARKAGVRVMSAVTEQRLGTEPTVSQERAR
ncbi:MAG: biopolymer transporter ExbD [Gemmatimonadales bacterium]